MDIDSLFLFVFFLVGSVLFVGLFVLMYSFDSGEELFFFDEDCIGYLFIGLFGFLYRLFYFYYKGRLVFNMCWLWSFLVVVMV